jgi:hypothetical protein
MLELFTINRCGAFISALKWAFMPVKRDQRPAPADRENRTPFPGGDRNLWGVIKRELT